jgi:hypothetical protein
MSWQATAWVQYMFIRFQWLSTEKYKRKINKKEYFEIFNYLFYSERMCAFGNTATFRVDTTTTSPPSQHRQLILF